MKHPARVILMVGFGNQNIVNVRHLLHAHNRLKNVSQILFLIQSVDVHVSHKNHLTILLQLQKLLDLIVSLEHQMMMKMM